MVCLGDVAELARYATDTYKIAVRVVKHSYEPIEKTKFLGNAQTKYEKKNWSSVIVFKNAYCRTLTPEYVEKTPGLDLHQFKWLKEEQIGDLPQTWNWLSGVYPKTTEIPKLVHYTTGTPCFNEYKNCDFSEYWHQEYQDMTWTAQR